MRVSPLLLGLGLAAALWGAAAAVSPRAGAGRPLAREELLYYPNGRLLREAALGYDQAAASAAWLRTVQYYGEHHRGDRTFDSMYHLCDVVTDLDPRFEEPYLFGSFVLLTEGHRPEEGMALLAKARRENPDSWRVLFESGFVDYIVWNKYAEAADYFRRAAALPGAPEYASRFAAYVSARAGETRTALLLWQELAQRSGNPDFRRMAEKKVEELQARLAAGEDGGS